MNRPRCDTYQPYISNGDEADPHEFPYIALLMDNDLHNQDQNHAFCGGYQH